MPPPSSGGVRADRDAQHPRRLSSSRADDPAQSLHLMIEAMKRAYADRARFLGDPDFVKVPVARLTVEELCRRIARAASIRERATPSRRDPRPPSRRRSRATTPRISRWSTASATRSPTPTRSISATASACRRRHRRPAQQRARRFRRQARRAECLRPGRLRGQRAGPGQAAAVVDDADHRAARTASRSSSPARRAAAASSPRCCRCCST